MYPAIDDSPEFQALLSGATQVDPARVALEIAGDAYPELDPAAEYARLVELGGRVAKRLGRASEPWLTLEAVTAVLFREEGLRGNEADFYDPRNSYLNEVLDRRRGIPISLGVIYLAVAQQVGLTLHGVNLPGHFVLRHETEDGPVFIDPFHGGCLLDQSGVTRLVEQVAGQELHLRDSQFAACSTAIIIRRLLYNLKAIYLRDRRLREAIPVLKRLALLNPDTPGELRDLGIACHYGDRPGEAAQYLEEYLRRSPYADDAPEIRLLLDEENGAPN